MRLPAPSAVGVRSKGAMLPIEMRGGKWTAEFPVETTGNLRLTVIAPNADGWRMIVKNGAETIDLRDSNAQFEHRKTQRRNRSGRRALSGGNFRLRLRGGGQMADRNQRREFFKGTRGRRGYLVVTTDSPYQIYSWIDTARTVVGSPIGLRASVFDASSAAENGQPTALKRAGQTGGGGNFVCPTARLSASVCAKRARAFSPPISCRGRRGAYFAQTIVSGITPKGENFVRTGRADFSGSSATARISARRREAW